MGLKIASKLVKVENNEQKLKAESAFVCQIFRIIQPPGFNLKIGHGYLHP